MEGLAQTSELALLLVKAGAVDVLVQFLASSSDGVQRAALDALSTLAGHGGAAVRVADVAAEPVVILLSHTHKTTVQLKALSVLVALASWGDEVQAHIAKAGGIIAVVQLLTTHTNTNLQERAAMALTNLGLNNNNAIRIAEVGGIEALVGLLAHKKTVVQEKASAALANIVTYNRQNQLRAARAGAIDTLVQLLVSPKELVREQAVITLMNMSVENADIQAMLADAGGIEGVISLLSSENETILANAACALYWIAMVHDSNRVHIAGAGGIKPLITLLAFPSERVQEEAIGALSNIGHNVHLKEMIGDWGAIEELSHLLLSPNPTVQQEAATALWVLAVNDRNKVYVARAGAIPHLVGLLSSPAEGVKEEATIALENLSLNAECMKLIVDAGGLEALVGLLSSPHTSVQDKAVWALENLARDGHNQTLIAAAGGIEALIELVLSTSVPEIQGACAGALMDLALNAENQIQILHKGGIEPLVGLLDQPNEGVQCKAAGALANLAGSVCDEIRTRIVALNGVNLLGQLISSPHCASKAIIALTKLASLDGEADSTMATLTENKDIVLPAVLQWCHSRSEKEFWFASCWLLTVLGVDADFSAEIRQEGGWDLVAEFTHVMDPEQPILPGWCYIGAEVKTVMPLLALCEEARAVEAEAFALWFLCNIANNDDPETVLAAMKLAGLLAAPFQSSVHDMSQKFAQRCLSALRTRGIADNVAEQYMRSHNDSDDTRATSNASSPRRKVRVKFSEDGAKWFPVEVEEGTSLEGLKVAALSRFHGLKGCEIQGFLDSESDLMAMDEPQDVEAFWKLRSWHIRIRTYVVDVVDVVDVVEEA
eukprot:TRINITY_DN8435_c0_g1_i1.p1 TRINITY_DN8435_c0_g1~~TRINITY_DN8435_c0_g1_i1.p1  ORF type:complete len:865 (+),score=184.83 TRINITY_DN8435_c0_g1_i1:100-2595(+)